MKGYRPYVIRDVWLHQRFEDELRFNGEHETSGRMLGVAMLLALTIVGSCLALAAVFGQRP